jgi:2-dehydropantoate 2-reductase
VQEGGVAIPFQNGVESHDVLRRVLGADHVLGGVAYIAATIREPGLIAHTGTMARLTVGAFEPALAQKAEAFVAACKAAGFDCDLAADIPATYETLKSLGFENIVTFRERKPVFRKL